MFYLFNQNNSGGSFDVDKEAGIAPFTIVEAATPEEANTKAECIGLYFDGCASDMDCSCCGDRWYEVDGYEETATPEVYGKSPEEYVKNGGMLQLWAEAGSNIAVHYLNGQIKMY